MRRTAQRRVIIHRLIAVESLGSWTFICSGKTGALIVNELTLYKAVLPDGTSFEATGERVGPQGEVRGAVDQGTRERLIDLCVTGVLANESYLDYAGGEWAFDGDIADVAFLVFAKKLGLALLLLIFEELYKLSVRWRQTAKQPEARRRHGACSASSGQSS